VFGSCNGIHRALVLGDAGLGALGMIEVLGVAPKILKFKNTYDASDTTKKASIEILIGRDATP